MHTLQTIQVAIVDDHTLVRAGLISLLHTIGGFNVMVEAESGEELLRKMSFATSLPDVCLIDVNMPGMNGFETTEKILQRWHEMKCIAVSMHSAEEVIRQMLKCGACGFVAKQATADELSKAVIETHYNGYYLSGIVAKKIPTISHKNIKDHAKKALNEKQIQFLRLTCSDLSYEEIGKIMCISPRTAEKYCRKLREDLDIHSLVGLVLYAIYTGIAQIDYK